MNVTPISLDEFAENVLNVFKGNGSQVLNLFFPSGSGVLQRQDFVNHVDSLRIYDRTRILSIFNQLDPEGKGIGYNSFKSLFIDPNQKYQEVRHLIKFVNQTSGRLLKELRKSDTNFKERLAVLPIKSTFQTLGMTCKTDEITELAKFLNAFDNNLIDYNK